MCFANTGLDGRHRATTSPRKTLNAHRRWTWSLRWVVRSCCPRCLYTHWCSEIGSLRSLDAPELRASSDVREPISLHQSVHCDWLPQPTNSALSPGQEELFNSEVAHRGFCAIQGFISARSSDYYYYYYYYY